ncbi:cutinase family protein [Mycobacterium sp.]|uniref:cutinase family protein n=1 Tax=Mycobacterium sp. TaxID=1785 RepID=UPI0039C8F6B7
MHNHESSPQYRRRSAGRWAGLGAAAVVASGVVLGASSAVSATVPTASAVDCPDVEVIFARGTSEPAGVGRVGQALVDSLRQQTGLNIDAYGVNYPAGKLQLGGGDGANDTIKRVKDVVQACPNTKIVLGGYSQGASVMDIVAGVPVGGVTWGSSLPPQYVDNITALATFGNIADRSGSPVSSQSQLLGAKAIDLCNPGDPICHAGPGNEWSDHTDGYVPTYTTQAATFIAAKLLSAGSGSLPWPSVTPGPGSPLGPGSTVGSDAASRTVVR